MKNMKKTKLKIIPFSTALFFACTTQAYSQIGNTKAPPDSNYFGHSENKAYRSLPDEYKTPEYTASFLQELEHHLSADDCKTELMHHLTAQVDENILPGLIVSLRREQKIDDVLFLSLFKEVNEGPLTTSPDTSEEPQRKKTKEPTKDSCDRYSAIKFARNTYLVSKETPIPSEFASKTIKKSHGLTQQVKLYQDFDGFQILTLAKLYQNFSKRISATSAEVIIHYGTKDSEIYALSMMEQYRMAEKMFHKEIEEMKLKPIFSGKMVTFEDVIMAALETGAVNGDQINTILNVKELWDPKVTFNQKMQSFMLKIGGPAMILVPPPFNQLVALGVIFLQSVAGKQKIKSAEERGISIF